MRDRQFFIIISIGDEIEMDDFYELLDLYAFDVEKAAKAANNGARPLREVIDEILEEAGLDAVAAV